MAVRVVALLSAVSGVLTILGQWTSYQHAPLMFRESAVVAGVALIVVMAAQMLVPILKVAVGLALWSARRWARLFAVVVLSVDVLLLAGSILRFHTIAAAWVGGIPAGMADASIVQTHSLWPAYATAAVSLGSLLVLAWRPRRREAES